jgi:ribonuclease P protein component
MASENEWRQGAGGMCSSAGARKAGKGLLCNRKLGRRERITEQYEYRQVIGKGTVIVGKRFKAYLLVSGASGRKAGFIAGRGVGNACSRNRAKRLLREAYRQLKPGMKAGEFGVVFVARRALAGAALADVESEMRSALGRLGLVVDVGAGRGAR